MINLPRWAKRATAVAAIGLASYLPLANAEGTVEYQNNSQDSVKTEQSIQKDYPSILREADGNLISNDVFVLERGKNHDIRKLFGFGNSDKIYAMNPITGLENMIDAMEHNPNVRDKFSWQRQPFIINDYKKDISLIEEYPKSQDYTQSLENLSNAVSDGELTSEEMDSIGDGFYMIKGDYNADYGKPAIIYIPSKSEASSNIESGNSESGLTKAQIEDIIRGEIKHYLKNHKPHSEKPKSELENKAREPSGRLPLSFVAGPTFSGNWSSVGIEGGLRFGYPEDTLNLALLGNVQKGLSGTYTTATGPTSPAGLYGVGTVQTSGFISGGVGLELYAGNENVKGLLGAGVSFGAYDKKETAEIKKGNLVLNSNNYSSQGYETDLRAYTGIDFALGKSGTRIELDGGIDYSLNSNTVNPFFGAKVTLGQPSKYK